jgi:hypothetical protein
MGQLFLKICKRIISNPGPKVARGSQGSRKTMNQHGESSLVRRKSGCAKQAILSIMKAFLRA